MIMRAAEHIRAAKIPRAFKRVYTLKVDVFSFLTSQPTSPMKHLTPTLSTPIKPIGWKAATMKQMTANISPPKEGKDAPTTVTRQY